MIGSYSLDGAEGNKMDVILLLPAGGCARRMGGLNKELLPIGNSKQGSGNDVRAITVLARALETGMMAGATRCIIVTSAAKASHFMEVVSASGLAIPTAYVHQSDPKGLLSAVALTAPHVSDENILLLLLPDTVIWPPSAVEELVSKVRAGCELCTMLVAVDRPERFGVAIFNDEGRILGFEDKPRKPSAAWVWTAVAFRASFLPYALRLMTNGESCFTAVLNSAAEDGKLSVLRSEASFWDVGTFEDYRAAISELQNLPL